MRSRAGRSDYELADQITSWQISFIWMPSSLRPLPTLRRRGSRCRNRVHGDQTTIWVPPSLLPSRVGHRNLTGGERCRRVLPVCMCTDVHGLRSNKIIFYFI